MAKNTNIRLRNEVIYSVYVRNHSKSGTFKGVYEDLERIKSLGVDIIWFMPIHTIGILNKKGSLGCPYAIRDYRAVNPEYGSLDDFKELVNKCNENNIDVIGIARNVERLEGVKTELGALGHKFTYYSMDVSKKESWETLKAELTEKGIQADILINNAGVLPKFDSFLHYNHSDIEKAMNINFYSAVFSMEGFIRKIRLTKARECAKIKKIKFKKAMIRNH